MIPSSENTSLPLPPAGIKLNALTADTLRYLGGQVGKVIEAKVVQVISELAGSVTSLNNSEKANNNSQKASNDGQQANNSSQELNSKNNANTQYRVSLSVGNQQISVKSPLAPRIGQILKLEVINYKTLSIVSAETNAHSTIVKPTQTTSNLPPITVSTQAQQQAAPSTKLQQQIAIVQTALRQSLPRQLSRSDLPEALKQITHLNTKLSAENKSQATQSSTSLDKNTANIQTAIIKTGNSHSVSATNSTKNNSAQVNLANSFIGTNNAITHSIETSIQQLKNSILPLEQLTVPNGVKQALLDSGIFFEKKIVDIMLKHHQLIPNTRANKSVATSQKQQNLNIDKAHKQLSSDLKYQLSSLADTLKSHLTKASATQDKNTNPSSLLRSAILSNIGRPDTTAKPLQPSSPLALLWQLDSNNLQHTTNNNNRETESNDAILQLLRLALGSVARTQNQQLQSLGSQLAANSDTASAQLLNAELPFWHDTRLNIIDIQLEREKSNKQKTDKPQAWNVRLRFDLEELGKLTALATLQGKNMAAVFWASQKNLATKINNELEGLERNLDELGLVVKQLHCSVGTIETQKNDMPVNLFNTQLLQEKT